MLLTALVTPSEPLAPCPPGADQSLPGAKVQAPPDAAVRYLVKLSVVPEESLRWNCAIAASGRVTPALAAAILGSFHRVIVLPKMPAMTAGVRVSWSTPWTLYAMTMAPPTAGMSIAGPVAQRASALVLSSPLRAESEPANEVCLLMKSVMPAPDPFGWYSIVAPVQALW